MNKLLSLLLFLGIPSLASCQQQTSNDLNQLITREVTETQLRYFASDELKGRGTGSKGIDMAADYIATHFQRLKIKELPGANGFFQSVPLVRKTEPEHVVVHINDQAYATTSEALWLEGLEGKVNGEIIFGGYGSADELEKLDVKGKVVVLRAGTEGSSEARSYLREVSKKKKLLIEKGALGMIELFKSSERTSWQFYINYLSRPSIRLHEGESKMPIVWLNVENESLLEMISAIGGKHASIDIGKIIPEMVPAKNVLGLIEGTDAELKKEYIILSAHYDHLGIVKAIDQTDSIFNGARDNGIGMVAVMSAAKYIANHPTKRSVIFAFWAAEEKGLLGSKYFVNNPLVPLKDIVYNLNIDGAGYNDTTIISVVGLERTSAKKHILAASMQMGLDATTDPVPELNLFDRSDNVNFARKGIPAPTMSTGFTAFDNEMMKYYHKATDEAEGLNFNYLLKYYKAYALAATAIANDANKPRWIAGDKYEAVGKELYGD